MSRQNLKKYLPLDKPVMEIGPCSNPFLKKEEHDIYYADISNAKDIAEHYKHVPAYDMTKIVPIDYVVNRTYLEAVGEKRFHAVFSSHVVEHTSNIIKHLQEISQILVEGGATLWQFQIKDSHLTISEKSRHFAMLIMYI